MVNVSPDFSVQVQGFPDLHPRSKPCRNTPIAGVLLTNADLDHLLGVFSLREAGGVEIHAAGAVRATAEAVIGLETVLNAFGGSRWHEPPREFEPVSKSADAAGLTYRAIDLPGKPPPFIRNAPGGVHSLAYQFKDPGSGKQLVVAPDVGAVTRELQQALEESEAILFDGTFWSNDELRTVRPGGRTALEMGHLTIQDHSLDLLARLPAHQKIYIHINNTNPILALGSPERAAVEAAGLTVGWDGLEFEL